MHFCTPRRVFAHAHYKLEFDNAESLSGRSDDNHTQTFSYYVHIKKISSKNKVALAVELSIDLVNDDVYTKFGLILTISSQDIE